MNLKAGGVIGRWYHWNFFDYPRNFCPFFWKLLISIVLFPLTCISVFDTNARSYADRLASGLYYWFMTVISTGMATMVGMLIYKHPWQALALLGWVTGVVAAVVAVVGICFWVYQSPFTDEISTIVGAKKDSVLNKYCPKIDWK